MAALVQASANTVTAWADAWTLVKELKKILVDSQNLDSVHNDMERKLNMLVALVGDHQQRIRQHVIKTSSRTHIEWVKSVGEIESQVKNLYKTYEIERERGSNIHCFSRASLVDDMRRKVSDISDLWEKSNQIKDGMSVNKEAERVVKIVEVPDIQGFPTLQNPLQDILNSLATNKIKGIEVRGSVGCGKTTIMQNLNNHEKVNAMFDIVIWVKVSTEDEEKKNSMKEHLQKVIIQRLKLDMDGVNNAGEVSNKIWNELNDKKYLILLDDVKEDLSLDEVGIPLLKANVGSKIVLATRKSNPLISHSLVDKVIKVNKLSGKEAWEMFNTILKWPDLSQFPPYIKHRVVKLCDGVPLMIKMVARCFKMSETKEDWSAEFRKLEYWPRKGDVAMPELNDVLNFCNGKLNDAQENCFLYSALYPEDGEIYVGGLLDGWWGEKLLGGGDDAIDMHAKARDILRHLKKMLFLEEGRNKEYVRMQKWIRKAALYTMKTAEKHNHLVRTSEALKELPEEEHWRQKKWISLVDNHLHTLPDKPECSVLSTLFLQENSNLIKIPDRFFECMKNLRVLGLYSTGIASLPSSLSNLISLKVLNLNNCTKLVVFPSQIVELHNLEVLDIRGSGLNNIPPQIQRLIRLRRLLATFTSIEETNNQAEVISKISTLKELIFDVRFSKERWDDMLNDVLKNLIALKKLTNLRVCIDDEDFDVIKMDDDAFKISAPKADHLNSFVKGRDELELQTIFQLFVGCSITEDPQFKEIFKYQRYVKYCNGKCINNSSVLDLLQKADALEIVKHVDLERLSDFGAPESSSIRGCLIQSCTKIRTILDGKCTSILSNLEHLYLNDLPELLSIWDDTIQLKSLCKLITLDVKNCPKLIEIFPVQKVNQASVNGVLRSRVNGVLRSRVFPELKKFKLVNMPKLKHVYEGDWLEWPSLEEVTIRNCPNLERVLFNNENAIKLIGLKMEP